MAQTWDTDELLVAIRSDARLADDDPAATDAILLAEATRIMHSLYVPAVRVARADYYVTEAHIPLVADRRNYPIPHRAATSSVRKIRLINVSDPRQEHELKPAVIEDLPSYYRTRPGVPTHYAIRDDRIEVFPTPIGATHALRVTFEYRPGQLVSSADAVMGLFVGISYDLSDDEFTLLSDNTFHLLLDDEAPENAYAPFDIISSVPPFSVLLMDVGYTSASQGFGLYEYTLTSWIGSQDRPAADVNGAAWVGDPSVDSVNGRGLFGTRSGDYMILAGTSVVPQIPPELHPCLAQHTAAKFLKLIDPEASVALKEEADDNVRRLISIMNPRKQGAQHKLKPRTSNIRGRRHGRGTFDDIR